MLNEQTLEKLHAMRLTGMAEAFAEQLRQPGIAELSFEERFGRLRSLHLHSPLSICIMTFVPVLYDFLPDRRFPLDKRVQISYN